MATKRRLTDMYRVQKSITFDDGQGDPVTVIVRKLNPIDHQTALRSANAARSRAATLMNRPDDDEYQAQWSMILDYDREALTRYLLEDLRLNRSPVLEAEMADEEEWKKDSYLEGLQHDWEDGMKDKYAMDPEDPDAKRVFSELERFTTALDEVVQAAVDNFEDDLDKKSEDELRKTVFEKLMASYSAIAWLTEYRRSEIALSTRTEDGKERYFNHRDEVSELPEEIFQALMDAYADLNTDVIEGKDSPVTEGSSPSSEPPASQATDSDSGQEAATE